MPHTVVAQRASPTQRISVNRLFDNIFFVFAGVAAVWLAWLVLAEGVSWGWGWNSIWFYLVFWLLIAYLVLPRLHRILTTIYVPNYFIGRARTSDGLLGDPVNLGFLGGPEQLHEAMLAAGWTRADDVTLASSWKIVMSTILRRSYDEAPVSPLALFGRVQDFAYQQEVKGNPAKRHHVRFWRCPDGWLLPGGHRADWLAAGTFDRAVGLSLFTLQITHKIDENTDVERDHIVDTLRATPLPIHVTVIKDFSTGYHSRNGGGDAINTDGDLPVVDLTALPIGPAPELPAEVAEKAARLAAESHIHRPVQTVLGAILVVARVLAGVGYLYVSTRSTDLVREALIQSDMPLTDENLVIGHLAVVFIYWSIALGVLVQASLATLVFRGSNWARITVMGVSSATIIVQATDYFAGGALITLSSNLVMLTLDILVLLALSSTNARVYARLTVETKRRRNKVRRTK